uniref:Uncharacterized protein n=2 Tax=Picea TaxID=3328 RepID=A0A101M0K5_PICGL|nr:hypothetical protein ABT39_MTgene4147 [Picea glauca]QHR90345.1 hypothetical protein Q903MT_gene4368 [Picea sitchensis]
MRLDLLIWRLSRYHTKYSTILFRPPYYLKALENLGLALQCHALPYISSKGNELGASIIIVVGPSIIIIGGAFK